MKITPTALPGAFVLTPDTHGDSRGYFRETYRADLLGQALGYLPDWMQQNESMSVRGVLRGLHYQAAPYAQAKLVGVTEGEIIDVAVDMRPGSPTLGRHIAVPLDSATGSRLFIPRGMAHGFVVLSERAVFQYLVDNLWHPGSERTLRYDDPTVGIRWPIPRDMQPILSDKDLRGMTWNEAIAEVLRDKE